MDSMFQLCMGYVYQLIALVKRWSIYFGLPLNGQNFEDTFYQLLHDKNYDEALKLAQQYKYLDIDLVYKCKWRNSSITIQLIDNVLYNIQDKLWAINECVRTVPMSYDACRRLLDFGLDEASLKLLYILGIEPPVGNSGGKHSGKLGNKSTKVHHERDKIPLLDDSDVEDDEFMGLVDFEHLNDQQKELCRCRQNLLRYSHSLEAYKNILGDYRTIQQDFDHVFWDEFRRKPPLASCIEFANAGDPHAVETCLSYYIADLSPHLLAILSNFPETLSPYQYRNLLPCLRQGEKIFQWACRTGTSQQPSHDEDWSARDETASIGTYLKDKNEAFVKEFYDKNEHLKKFNTPLPSELLTKWYIERALEMEDRTLLLSYAIQLLNLGMELGIKDLEKTHDDLKEFDRIIYDCCTDDNIYLSFGEFNKMSEIKRLILMTGDSVKNCKDRFRFYVIPYLHRREANYNLKAKVAILREYFQHLANMREQICRTIYNDLLDRIECDNFVAEWTNGMDDAIDEIGEEIKRIERERQVKQVSTVAKQTFALGDFDECYETCKLIMKKDFKECWEVCYQLGMHQKYTNNEAKYKLLAYALANCDDPDGKISVKTLEYIVELRKRDPKIQLAYLKLNM